jgi:hypothetical protein
MLETGVDTSHTSLGIDAINLEHPSLLDIDPNQIERTQLTGIDSAFLGKLNIALQEIYPGHKPFQPKPEEIPNYQTAAIIGNESSEEGSEKPQTAYILFTGNATNSDSTLQDAAELYKCAKNNSENVAFSATVGSSNSLETMNTKFTRDPVERGMYQAINLMNLIKNHPSKNLELVISSQSLASMDLLYGWPIMEKLLENEGLDPKKTVRGLILLQPAGIQNQKLSEFIKNTLAIVPDTLEQEDHYPTEENIANFDVAIEKATTEGDGAQVFLLKERQKKLTERRENIRQAMMRENPAISDEVIQKKVNEHVNAEIVQGAKQKRELLPNKRSILMALATLPPWIKKGNMLRTAPKDIRERIDVPIAVAVTEQDKLFPDALKSMTSAATDEAIQRQREAPDENLDTIHDESQFFSHSPQLIEAVIAGLPHKGYGAEPQEFARIISRISSYFKSEQSSSAPQKQSVTKLTL